MNTNRSMKNLFRYVAGLLLFLCLDGAWSTDLYARLHTRRTGKIEDALKEPEKRPIQLAAAPKPTELVTDEQTPTSFVAGVHTEMQKANQGDTPQAKQGDAPFGEQPSLALPLELQPDRKQEEQLLASMKKTELTVEDEPEKIELQFEETDLQNFIAYIEEIFKVTFLADEAISPLRQGAKPIKGNKISFKTNEPLSRDQVWNLFVTFLEISGFTVVKTPEPNIYRIEQLEAARKAPIPAYLGVPYETLPDDNQIIRYLYFIENSTVDAISSVVTTLKSPDAPLVSLKEHKAFLITDKAYNIKSLMKIVKELDRVTMPQAMSVLKLREASAEAVKKLYEDLTQQGEQVPFRPGITRKQPTSLFFPENTRIIVEPRTNSLILLGTKDAIKKIEEFITKYVDVELDQPYSPLHMYQLKYAKASVISKIMNDVAQPGFAKVTEGSVRGSDKFLKSMSFVAEEDTNRLIIKGDYNDYLSAKEIIEKLDEQQAQVAIEVLIMTVELDKNKELGAQIRSKVPGLDGILGKNVEFQTSGMRAGGPPSGIITNPLPSNTQPPDPGAGSVRLLGNLLEILTTGGRGGPGNSVLSLGRDMFGVWGLLQALEVVTNMEVISNPFVIATNKTPALIEIGEIRRVATGTVIPSGGPETTTRDDAKAALKVQITPQINSDGMIALELMVDLTQFTDLINLESATRTTKEVKTYTLVADKEVIALGGLIRTSVANTLSKTPILGDIPLIGWLFKNQSKVQQKDNLLILISTSIIEPQKTADVNKFTQERLNDYHGSLAEMVDAGERHDPIHKLFFKEDKSDKVIEDFIFDRRKERDKKKQTDRTRARRGGAVRARKQELTKADDKQESKSLTHSLAAPSLAQLEKVQKAQESHAKSVEPKKEEPEKKPTFQPKLDRKHEPRSLGALLAQSEQGGR